MGVPFLRKVLRELGVARSDLEDVLQDVLFAAYRARDRFDASRSSRAPSASDEDPASLDALLPPLRGYRSRRAFSPLCAWLFGIAWRQVSHHRDRAYRRREVPMGLHGSTVFARVDAEPALEHHVAEAEQAQLISRLLRTLRLQRRTILVMHDMLEIPVVEIARELGINENTAQNRLRLARLDFRAAAKRLSPEAQRALRR